MTSSATSLPYDEPSIIPILVLSSFLLCSNIVNWALDRLVYCGIIGQILIGVAWGTPGGKWLDGEIETTIVQFGYLGLILLIYEGGLSTSFQSLKADILLSSAVALTGISIPIALSFTLSGIANATSLQAFAAGAALCSTSLGTTFTILKTTGLIKTRLGVVLTSAAVLDDVVGLVMVQVISNLGSSQSGISAITIVRPCLVSLAFAILCPLACWLVVKPITLNLNHLRERKRDSILNRIMSRQEFVLSLHTALLIGMVTGATYAGTSNLFAAYLAGAMISWWDTVVPHCQSTDSKDLSEQKASKYDTAEKCPTTVTTETKKSCSGATIYEQYYSEINEKILKPFFFASIGFSIPVTRMFHGSTLWRGVIYSIFMLVAKLLCGVWLVRFAISFQSPTMLQKIIEALKFRHVASTSDKHVSESLPKSDEQVDDHPNAEAQTIANDGVSAQSEIQNAAPANICHDSNPVKRPFSLYPGAILGLAMVARGEIGFLISSLAESKGVFSTDQNDEVYLIVTWAIVLCTLIGPVGVGMLVLRVRKLEKAKKEQVGGKDVLGVWGVNP